MGIALLYSNDSANYETGTSLIIYQLLISLQDIGIEIYLLAASLQDVLLNLLYQLHRFYLKIFCEVNYILVAILSYCSCDRFIFKSRSKGTFIWLYILMGDTLRGISMIIILIANKIKNIYNLHWVYLGSNFHLYKFD